MTQSLYVASLEPDSGKLVISLGVMEMLSRRVDRLGFFRPISSGPAENDSHIQLFNNRFSLSLQAEQMVGWSIQQEFHLKKVTDRFRGESARMRGAYLAAGWFPSSSYAKWSAELELAGRVALVSPYADADLHENKELTVGVNWFFNGHRNKLTTDVSRLEIDDPMGETSDWRFRLQWDVSL